MSVGGREREEGEGEWGGREGEWGGRERKEGRGRGFKEGRSEKERGSHAHKKSSRV